MKFVAIACSFFSLVPALALAQQGSEAPSRTEVKLASGSKVSSTFIPLDSWIYVAALRLYEKGYLPTVYLGMRPWTRSGLAHALRLSKTLLTERTTGDDEAVELYFRLQRELRPELDGLDTGKVVLDNLYVRARGVQGEILDDSFHAGQTFINDFGRVSRPGFNIVAGGLVRASYGRFTMSMRAEQQHTPSGTGYGFSQASYLTAQDGISQLPNFTTPYGALPRKDDVRIIQALASVRLANHEISIGKNDAWLGAAQGGAFTLSNNARNLYALHVNRVEPVYIPFVSRITGPFRYQFLVGSLKHHTSPNSPWMHTEKFSFKPTPDLEFGFARTVIWGGKGHVPITLETFLRSFFSLNDVQPAVKMSRKDPGARFSFFDASWRIPWQANLLRVYVDGAVHDDVSPIASPDRAAFRSGLVLTRLPGSNRTSLRAEAVYTDIPDRNSVAGVFLMTEYIQKEGYTNEGNLMGDWIGRESKGGQIWLTYHTKPDQYIQFDFRTAKVAKDFVPTGTTQQAFGLSAALRPARNLEVLVNAGGEIWRSPFLASGTQKNGSFTARFTYFPFNR